jgi:hypothetical protein
VSEEGKDKSEAEKARKARLAAELKANLARRKAQARARHSGEADARDEGIPAAGNGPSERDDADR